MEKIILSAQDTLEIFMQTTTGKQQQTTTGTSEYPKIHYKKIKKIAEGLTIDQIKQFHDIRIQSYNKTLLNKNPYRYSALQQSFRNFFLMTLEA